MVCGTALNRFMKERYVKTIYANFIMKDLFMEFFFL